jgi:probable addiction module antidote protein
MPKVTARTEPYREGLLASLKDPDQAAHYLSACLEDNDPRLFLLALRDVADAHGGISILSRDARLNRESLYRMLSRAGNPSLQSLSAILHAVGLRLSVRAETTKRGKRRVA